MKVNWKRLFGSLAAAAGLVLLIGGPTFILFLFGSLGAFPLYVTRVIPVVGIAGLLAALLAVCARLSLRGKRYLKYGFLCVCLASAAYAGWGFYHDSIPTVDDRSLLLWDYVPFEEENKLVSLEQEASLQFDSPYAVTLDGATALYPIYAAFAQAVYPQAWPDSGIEIDYSPYNSTVACSGTIEAYERLIRGEVDLIFAAGPSQAQLDAAYKAGMVFHMTPIGREAFVFFVNSKNPVTGLTVEQIQGIYTGSITNWSQVGGKNQKIRPFQRAENSGSQTSLQRLMAGLPLIEPEEEDRIAGMGGIIREVASYRNYKNAIGFSFRYYSTEMVQNGDIRLLALNGVEPNRETIRDGSYPIASEFYAVTSAPIGSPAPEESDPDIASLLEWVLSGEGQAILEQTGYVGVDS